MTSPMTIESLLRESASQLKTISPTPQLDAEVLLMFALNADRVFLYTYGNRMLSKTEQELFDKCLKRRLNGEPIAYITGQKAFWSLAFKVSPAVLIPRPETELLVECVLENLPAADTKISVLELGTGSGIIAVCLAKYRPLWSITAVDINQEALAIAKENEHTLLTNSPIQWLHSNWFESIPNQTFSVIISNPPYIADNDLHLQSLSFEPQNALVSGHDGLDAIRTIVTQSLSYLEDEGQLFIEHGYQQADAVYSLFQQAGFRNIILFYDISGQPRVTTGKK